MVDLLEYITFHYFRIQIFVIDFLCSFPKKISKKYFSDVGNFLGKMLEKLEISAMFQLEFLVLAKKARRVNAQQLHKKLLNRISRDIDTLFRLFAIITPNFTVAAKPFFTQVAYRLVSCSE